MWKRVAKIAIIKSQFYDDILRREIRIAVKIQSIQFNLPDAII